MNEFTKKIAQLPNWLIYLLVFLPLFGITLLPAVIRYAVGYFLLIWYLCVAFELHKRLPAGVNLSLKKYIFTLAYSLIYLEISHYIFEPGAIDKSYVPFIIPFHLFAMYCIFYGFYFISKSLVAIEDNKDVRFDRYLGTIFMMWFFPIGIWFVVPRIKKQLTTSL